MTLKKVLIIDDEQEGIEMGGIVLKDAYEVSSFHVKLLSKQLGVEDSLIDKDLIDHLQRTDIVLIDKSFGLINSIGLIILIRQSFPKLPIIRWTGGSIDDNHAKLTELGVPTIEKPVRRYEDNGKYHYDVDVFLCCFKKALDSSKKCALL